jgi:hypothetical protein
MKKALALMTALLTVFAFVVVASAADDEYNWSEGTAYNCKCEPGTVDCPGKRAVSGVQGSVDYITDPTFPFDFDGNGYADGGFGSYGYCTGYNYDEDGTRNCKLIFDVCSCASACAVEPGKKMGIQMYIKTNGVYWADPNMDKIYFDMYQSVGAICATDGLKRPLVTDMSTAPYFRDADDREIAGEVDADGELLTDPAGWEVRNFGEIKYYRDIVDVQYNSKSKFETGPMQDGAGIAIEGLPKDGAMTTSLGSYNRVRLLQSFESTDYMFTAWDTRDAAGNCKIWIDVPAMRIDPNVATPGETIKLQVRLLFNRKPTGICPECDPPDVCEAVIDVGVVCCDSTYEPTETEHCMFFPYVIQGGIQGWSTGIAVSARETTVPADAWVQLELRDTQGVVTTYRRAWGGSSLVWAFVLDTQMDNFDKTLTPGAAALKVTSNFSMDGYQFMNANQTFGAGSNARGCTAGQCCPK